MTDDLFVSYQKVSFLPAYFYKVFIKKKKPEAEKQKPGTAAPPTKPGAPAKPDPKNPKGKPEATPPEEQGASSKTKKLMEELK